METKYRNAVQDFSHLRPGAAAVRMTAVAGQAEFPRRREDYPHLKADTLETTETPLATASRLVRLADRIAAVRAAWRPATAPQG